VKKTSFNREEILSRLKPGEKLIEHAPVVSLKNGQECIPQHYFLYQHTRASVEQLVLDIDYCDRHPIFVDEDQGGIYIQVGIIGCDNYERDVVNRKNKLTYGRKWRVEPSLPTSEIIQTVFLALKKVREHEARELFRLSYKGCTTTPFNTHHDLPLMANHHELLLMNDISASATPDKKQMTQWLNKITYDFATLTLKNVEQRANSQWLIDIQVQPQVNTYLPELASMEITLLLPKWSINLLCFQLMTYFITLSDQHVNENFCYQQFARFSQNNDILAIAELSVALRKIPSSNRGQAFVESFTQANYQTDSTRVPKLHEGRLSHKIHLSLTKFGALGGILPD
jgi:hypothetical protein